MGFVWLRCKQRCCSRARPTKRPHLVGKARRVSAGYSQFILRCINCLRQDIVNVHTAPGQLSLVFVPYTATFTIGSHTMHFMFMRDHTRWTDAAEKATNQQHGWHFFIHVTLALSSAAASNTAADELGFALGLETACGWITSARDLPEILPILCGTPGRLVTAARSQ